MILDRLRLDDRVALVTGAGRGIGRGIALALAEAGADVVCAARTPGQIEETADRVRARGRRALAVPCDVTDPEQRENAVEKALAAHVEGREQHHVRLWLVLWLELCARILIEGSMSPDTSLLDIH